jgi:hypothetical protein
VQKTSKIFYLGFLLLCQHVFAEPVTSSPNTSTASTAEVATTAQAGNSDNNQNINFNSGSPLGKSTLVTTGSANLAGFSGSFSSDYCGSTVQAGVGGLGFGVSGGMARIDNTCVMLRTFERTQQAASALIQIDPIASEKLRRASIAILAEIDPKIKLIYEKHGLLDANGIGLVGKLNDANANTKVISDVKPNIQLQVDSIANVSSKMSASQSQGKPNNEQQVEVIPLVFPSVIPSNESFENPKSKSLWDRLKSITKF